MKAVIWVREGSLGKGNSMQKDKEEGKLKAQLRNS